jgi:hypothetical protein
MVINTFAQGTKVIDTFGTILFTHQFLLFGVVHMNNILFIKPSVYPTPKQKILQIMVLTYFA